jgi:arylsulfatase A-like enzyme
MSRKVLPFIIVRVVRVVGVVGVVGMIAGCATAPKLPPAPKAKHNVIILVWDGLRPDVIRAEDTPNLARLRDAGTDFTDHHSIYPTFTMMNSAGLATGAFPDTTGYFGNTVWAPQASGNDSAGKPVDFRQPVFTEDYGILDAIAKQVGNLLTVDTLFSAAQRAGIVTAAVGKNGAAYLQDSQRGGIVVDEKTVIPLELARELVAAGLVLPATAPNAFPPSALTLSEKNGNPIDFKPPQRLADGVSTDPTDDSGSRYTAGTEVLVALYLGQVLPQKHPRLSVVWLRDPDSTQHQYGLNTTNVHAALRANDAILGRLLAKIEELGEKDVTDVIVVSDHGHSDVAGPEELFPLRAVRAGELGDVDPKNGVSTSGLVRLADLLRRGGFTAFDGLGCTYLPGSTGIRKDGSLVYPARVDADGKTCGKEGQKYQVAAMKVPAELPPHSLVLAVNGGSDYVYVPEHDAELVKKTVRFLQERSEIGAIFVDDRYGRIPGTMSLGTIHAENAAGRNPDIIVSYDYDENRVIGGIRGVEMAGTLGGATYRGMHGSFSPRDVHATLIGFGPDFRAGWKDTLPSSNVDVAPTVARILGIALPKAQGRALLEAVPDGPPVADYQVALDVLHPAAPATGLTVRLPTDPDGKDVAPGVTTYNFAIETHTVTFDGKTYRYFDRAKATRK